jgi:hypothetical protein
MTPTELLQCLARLREIFPQPIQMEWSNRGISDRNEGNGRAYMSL